MKNNQKTMNLEKPTIEEEKRIKKLKAKYLRKKKNRKKRDVGPCFSCGKLTSQKHYFTDDGETRFLDYCHDICFELLLEKL